MDAERNEQQPDDGIVEDARHHPARPHAVIGADVVQPRGDDLSVDDARRHGFLSTGASLRRQRLKW
jgi:hypothetical protein